MELNATAGTLLGFLIDGPMTGWDLMSMIDASVGNFWNVTRSQVYRELARLAEARYVTEERAGPRDRRPYRITASGRAAFRCWLSEGPPAETRRVPVLLTTFFGAHLDPARLTAILDAEEAKAAAEQESYEAVEQLVEDPFQRATLAFGVGYLELMRRWIAEVARPLIEPDSGEREPSSAATEK